MEAPMFSKNPLWLAVALLCAGSVFAQTAPVELSQREGQGGQRGQGQGGQTGQRPGQGGQRPAEQGRPAAPQRGQAAEARKRLDTALDQVAASIQAKRVQRSDWDAVRTALRERGADDAAASARTRRFEALIDRLGQNQQLSAAHVESLRGAFIDERLDDALARWRNAAAEGKVTEQEHQEVAQQLARRAEVAQAFGPAGNDGRANLQAQLDGLRERAKTTQLRPADIDEFRSRLFDARLQWTLADLERRAARNDVSGADLESVRWLLEDRAADAGEDPEFRSLQTRLQNALQGLERKLSTGKIDSAEFAKLRSSFTQKARKAASDTPPAERRRDEK
jgi:hypothetical protein